MEYLNWNSADGRSENGKIWSFNDRGVTVRLLYNRETNGYS